jgi:signal transduction histidine kinase
LDIGKQVLDKAWASLSINLESGKVHYEVKLRGAKKARALTVTLDHKIKAGLVADIRYFPRRQGIFSGAEVDGRAAWTWVRENCGVAVVDHGFRIRPFGFTDDDWLHLAIDATHNERDWRSSIAKSKFPIAPEIRARPGDNPALNLPTNFQLVGAVFVDSNASGGGKDLTTAMDREGFLKNEAFDQLVDVVRGGIEFLAHVDKEQLLASEEKAAREAVESVREDFKAAIESIRNSETLAAGDRNRLVRHYADLSTKLEEVEEYGRQARRRLETMGLLGVVAGFMTHEAARILDGLETALKRLGELAKRDPSVASSVKQVQEGYEAFKGHVDYTTLFIDAVHKDGVAEFKAAPQIDRILQRFGTFASEHHVAAENDVAESVRVKGVPVAAYSGVLLNLYTNALKAVLARHGRAPGPHIVFRAWSENGRHVVEVIDKGIGIPPELRSRVFDPLFTTTSNTGNPLGSGMGLGLSLVRDVVNQVDGKILIVDPPAGFATCFRLEFRGG